MIKVCELVQRRPDLTVEEFQAYWRDTHGPIVSAIPGLRRYVQSHPFVGGYSRGPLPYDGMAEVWVDDKQALRDMAQTSEFAAAKADEPNFIDTDSLIELVVDDHVVKNGAVPDDAIKSIAFVHFRDDLSPAEAHAYWRDVHGPIAADIPSVRRYVQSHTRLGAYGRAEPPPCDGVAITWFESKDDMRAGVHTDAFRATRADEANFLRPGPVDTLLTREIVYVE